MDDATGTEVDTSTEVQEPSGPVETAEPTVDAANDSSSVNPAWESVRTKLDPVSFHAIQDELKKWDQSFNTRSC